MGLVGFGICVGVCHRMGRRRIYDAFRLAMARMVMAKCNPPGEIIPPPNKARFGHAPGRAFFILAREFFLNPLTIHTRVCIIKV